MEKNKNLAVVRVRGPVKINKEIESAMQLLRLYRKNYCTVVEATPLNLGMIKKVKNYVTFGEIDDETYRLLTEKRGKEHKGKKGCEEGKTKYRPFFRLNPPKKGFGRKGIKVDFQIGGALGDRKEKINELIKRMI